jgi:hypothetical protein
VRLYAGQTRGEKRPSPGRGRRLGRPGGVCRDHCSGVRHARLVRGFPSTDRSRSQAGPADVIGRRLAERPGLRTFAADGRPIGDAPQRPHRDDGQRGLDGDRWSRSGIGQRGMGTVFLRRAAARLRLWRRQQRAVDGIAGEVVQPPTWPGDRDHEQCHPSRPGPVRAAGGSAHPTAWVARDVPPARIGAGMWSAAGAVVVSA